MVSTKVSVKTCIIDGCSKPRRSTYPRCHEHHREYQRACRERQKASKPRRVPRVEQQCFVGGCPRPVHAQHLCHSHYKFYAIRKPCSIPGCRYGRHAQELCIRHYNAAHRRKDFQRVQLQGVLSPEERFRQYVQITDTCHIWTGYQIAGRGHFTIADQATQAHRAAWELDGGTLPVDEKGKPLELDHGCRIPLCVRTDHLEPVTSLENARRQNVAAGYASFDQRDGWLLFVAIPEWQRGASNFPSSVVTTHPSQVAS